MLNDASAFMTDGTLLRSRMRNLLPHCDEEFKKALSKLESQLKNVCDKAPNIDICVAYTKSIQHTGIFMSSLPLTATASEEARGIRPKQTSNVYVDAVKAAKKFWNGDGGKGVAHYLQRSCVAFDSFENMGITSGGESKEGDNRNDPLETAISSLVTAISEKHDSEHDYFAPLPNSSSAMALVVSLAQQDRVATDPQATNCTDACVSIFQRLFNATRGR